MSVEIRETPIGGDLGPFLDVVDTIYRDDPCYVRPLDMEVRDRLSRKNPFFEHAEGTTFTAWKEGRCVGRIVTHIDRVHLERYKDGAGSFGVFDTIDDDQVARALLEEAAAWLSSRGMKSIRGPLSLSTNDELGLLVEGFDTPAMVMMPHHRPYQGGLVEAAGFTKLKDLFAWHYQVGDLPARAKKAHEQISALPELRLRRVDMRNLDREVRVIMDVYNDAWHDNWGFLPTTEAELTKMAADLKLIADPQLTQVVELDGEPVAVAIALPNVNESLVGLRGKLFPLGFLRLLWRLKVRRPTTARLMVLGIRRRLRQVRRYAALSTYMFVEMHRAAATRGVTSGELSWTLEDNAPVNAGIRFMGGRIYKRYRLYERAL